MITQMNLTNQDEYLALFEEAAIALRKPEHMEEVEISETNPYEPGKFFICTDEGKYVIATAPSSDDTVGPYYKIKQDVEVPATIDTLQEYFYYLKSLAQLDDLQPKFMVLPLDEPHFEIDANSRTVKVPDEFRKNGIGVQGDHGAEIVYFTIDRYFDNVDFARNDVSILIQWEVPKGKTENNETDTNLTGVSPAYNIDYRSEPGKVIFGWRLTKDITRRPGNVNFSVRFIIWKDSNKTEYDYSFSTLTTSVGINPALQLVVDDLQTNDNVADSIKNLIVKTQSPISNEVIALHPPTFIKPEQPSDLTATREIEIDLVKQADGTYSRDLVVQAVPSSQGGAIQYIWSLNEDNNAELEQNGVFVEVEKDAEGKLVPPNPNVIYYQLNVSGNQSYYSVLPITDNKWPDGVTTAYQKVGIKTLTGTGKYEVSAIAKSGVYLTSKPQKSRTYWIVPEPKEMELVPVENDSIKNESLILSETKMVGDSEPNKVKVYFANTNIHLNGVPKTTSNNNEKSGEGTTTNTNYEYHDILAQWYKKITTNVNGQITEDWQKIEGETSLEFKPEFTIDTGNKTETTLQQGLYKIIAEGKKNNSNTEKVTKTYVITFPLITPSVDLYQDKTSLGQHDNECNIDKPVTVALQYNGDYDIVSDYLTTTFQWYKYGQTNFAQTEADKTSADLGTYVPKATDTLLTTEPSPNSAFTPTAGGRYFCIIKLDYNGDQKTISSPIISVITN